MRDALSAQRSYNGLDHGSGISARQFSADDRAIRRPPVTPAHHAWAASARRRMPAISAATRPRMKPFPAQRVHRRRQIARPVRHTIGADQADHRGDAGPGEARHTEGRHARAEAASPPPAVTCTWASISPGISRHPCRPIVCTANVGGSSGNVAPIHGMRPPPSSRCCRPGGSGAWTYALRSSTRDGVKRCRTPPRPILPRQRQWAMSFRSPALPATPAISP